MKKIKKKSKKKQKKKHNVQYVIQQLENQIFQNTNKHKNVKSIFSDYQTTSSYSYFF